MKRIYDYNLENIFAICEKMVLSLIIGSAAVICFLLAYHQYYVKVFACRRKQLNMIPVQWPSFPLIGSSYHLEKGPEFRKQIFNFCYRQHGSEGISVMWIGFYPIVFIWKAEYVEALLTSNQIKKSSYYDFFKGWLGEGLLISYGQKWYHHRKLLTPSFHFRILNDFVPVMNEHAQEFVKQLEKHADKDEEFDMFPLVTMTTLNVICEAAMGQTTEDEDRKERTKVFKAVIELSHLIQQRQLKVHLWPDIIFGLTQTGRKTEENLKIIQDYTDKIFKERLESFDRVAVEKLMFDDCHHRRPLPFLDSLLYSSDNFTKLTEQDIKDEVNTFLFTGHDTTAASTAFTLYLLARHPEAQQKVHEELDAVFGNSNRCVTIEDVRKLKYLSACLKESLRLYPVAPMYGRELEKDLKLGEYTIPAGVTVGVLNEILHRDPVYFENPEAFKPERFFTKNMNGDEASKFPSFAYVPFSAGQRNCIGQKYAQIEDKIIVASVLRRFQLECDYSDEDIAPAVEVILRPTKGMFFRVKYR